jgi:hypothetical protein
MALGTSLLLPKVLVTKEGCAIFDAEPPYSPTIWFHKAMDEYYLTLVTFTVSMRLMN